MGLAEDIQQRINYLSKLVEAKENAVAWAPEGTLKIHFRNGNPRYCMKTDETKSEIYLPKKDFAKACSLAQRSYDKKVLMAARAELKSLERINGFYENAILPEDCYPALSSSRMKLVKPVVLTDEQYIEKWKKEHPPRATRKPDTVYVTKKGDKVRSRVEILISDRLFAAGLTYQYETPLVINGLVYHPDFCVLNLRRRETFWWEHFGMMDDPDYLEDAILKLNKYAQNGIIIGKNLIVTFETIANPSNTSQIDQIIQTFLV